LERGLRIATFVVAAAVAVAMTGVAAVNRHQGPARAPDQTGMPALASALGAPAPSERVVGWELHQLLAAQAAAAQPARLPARRAAPASGYGSGPIQDIITRAFTPYGPTAVAWGLRVARCESGFNPRAYNPAGPYYGLFQFLMSAFRSTPYGTGDIYDPAANAGAAAWKYAHGGAGAWGCR